MVGEGEGGKIWWEGESTGGGGEKQIFSWWGDSPPYPPSRENADPLKVGG